MEEEIDLHQIEMNQILQLLKSAEPYRLQVEVFWSALNAAKEGSSIEECIAYARREWDL